MLNPSKLLAVIWCLIACVAVADETWPTITDFKWTERRQQSAQREWVSQLAKEKLGQSIRQNTDDLATLQRIIQQGLIEADESYRLQALGVVLGDLFVQELGLVWKIYEDEQGRSRAACAPNTDECLFPITMLSRRLEVGLKSDVAGIYHQAKELIQPHLPTLPYEVKR